MSDLMYEPLKFFPRKDGNDNLKFPEFSNVESRIEAGKPYVSKIQGFQQRSKNWYKIAQRATETYYNRPVTDSIIDIEEQGDEISSLVNATNMMFQNTHRVIPLIKPKLPRISSEARMTGNDDIDKPNERLADMIGGAVKYDYDNGRLEDPLVDCITGMMIQGVSYLGVNWKSAEMKKQWGEVINPFDQVEFECLRYDDVFHDIGPYRQWKWAACRKRISKNAVALMENVKETDYLNNSLVNIKPQNNKTIFIDGLNIEEETAGEYFTSVHFYDAVNRIITVLRGIDGAIVTQYKDPLMLSCPFNFSSPFYFMKDNLNHLPECIYAQIKTYQDRLNSIAKQKADLIPYITYKAYTNGMTDQYRQSVESKKPGEYPISDIGPNDDMNKRIAFHPAEMYANSVAQLREEEMFCTERINDMYGIPRVMNGGTDARESGVTNMLKSIEGHDRLQVAQRYVIQGVSSAFQQAAEMYHNQGDLDTIQMKSGIYLDEGYVIDPQTGQPLMENGVRKLLPEDQISPDQKADRFIANYFAEMRMSKIPKPFNIRIDIEEKSVERIDAAINMQKSEAVNNIFKELREELANLKISNPNPNAALAHINMKEAQIKEFLDVNNNFDKATDENLKMIKEPFLKEKAQYDQDPVGYMEKAKQAMIQEQQQVNPALVTAMGNNQDKANRAKRDEIMDQVQSQEKQADREHKERLTNAQLETTKVIANNKNQTDILRDEIKKEIETMKTEQKDSIDTIMAKIDEMNAITSRIDAQTRKEVAESETEIEQKRLEEEVLENRDVSIETS